MKLSYIFIISSLILLGCGKKDASNSASSTAADPLAPRYSNSLSDGIDFKKNGYPTFIKSVSGVSGLEVWGRWSDANLGQLKFEFNEPLPNKFALEIQAFALGPNEGKNILIKACNKDGDLVIKNEPPDQTYKVNFDGVINCDSIELIPPKPVTPHELNSDNPDTRLMSLGLKRLSIVAN
jgi:phosphoglycerol transferase